MTQALILTINPGTTTIRIGLFVPPTGLAVLVACSVGKVRMEQMIKPLMPFLLLLLVGLAVIIFVPWISTALPQAMELTY